MRLLKALLPDGRVLLRDGWVWGLVVLVCGLSVFRWPVIHLFRWLTAR